MTNKKFIIGMIIIILFLLLVSCSKQSTIVEKDNVRFIIIYEQGSDWDKYFGIVKDVNTGNEYLIVDIGYGVGITELNNLIFEE